MKSMLMRVPAGQPPDLAGSCCESNPELLQCCCPAGQVAHHACTALQTKCVLGAPPIIHSTKQAAGVGARNRYR